MAMGCFVHILITPDDPCDSPDLLSSPEPENLAFEEKQFPSTLEKTLIAFGQLPVNLHLELIEELFILLFAEEFSGLPSGRGLFFGR
jgi:hypothetical protein